MKPAEVTQLLEATRDDLVRDIVATLAELGVLPRLLTPAEIERLRLVALPHVNAGALVGARYEQAKHLDDEPTRATAPPAAEPRWVGEDTPARRPSARPKVERRRRRDDRRDD